MRIQSVSLALGGNRLQPASASGHQVDSQVDALVHADDVLLHQDNGAEAAAALGLETLLALIQGILEASTASPVGFSDAIRTNTQLMDPRQMPPWLLAAERSLASPNAEVCRLCAIGTLLPKQDAPLPFVLDLQLLHAGFSFPEEGITGGFSLPQEAGGYAGAQVSFTLSRTGPASTDRMTGQQPPLATPLFAQFAFGWQPDILCIAARLLPAVAVNAVLQHLAHPGDGSYVTMEEANGSPHQVDVCA